MSPTTHHSSFIFHPSSFPQTRLRRLRQAPWVRELVAETRLHVSDLIWPAFVMEGLKSEIPIESLAGVNRMSVDVLVARAKEAHALGIQAIALFPQVDVSKKTDDAKEALNPDNLICRAIRALKTEIPTLGIITDIALDPYTPHGHDGIVEKGDVANDKTVEILCKQALLMAQTGADVVAPSDMMDGRIGAIRNALENASQHHTLILSYAAKYASALYEPFRDAVGSAQKSAPISKATYQMNPANTNEAMREIAMDIAEGADMVMVKPALPYLDIIQRAATEFNIPVFAYHVSGEYAMAHAMPNADDIIFESLIAMKRAGAQAIFTYAAVDVAKQLRMS